MESSDEIESQLERLHIHRTNLSYLLRQQAQHGSLHIPLHIMNSITTERASIQQIKAILRERSIPIDDHPDDTAYYIPTTSLSSPQDPSTSSVPDIQPDSSSQVSIPVDVMASIRTQAANRFGTDFATQKFRIRTEMEAWHTIQTLVDTDLPSEILQLIKQNAAARFPLDFGTQLYQITNQPDAWHQLQNIQLSHMPNEVLNAIVHQATQQFPYDFATRLFVVKQQITAWEELQQ